MRKALFGLIVVGFLTLPASEVLAQKGKWGKGQGAAREGRNLEKMQQMKQQRQQKMQEMKESARASRAGRARVKKKGRRVKQKWLNLRPGARLCRKNGQP